MSVPTSDEKKQQEKLALRIKINGSRGDATSGKRSRPNKAKADAILAKQNHRCLYCDIPFGTELVRRGPRGGLVVLRLNWDHFVPYSWCATNPHDNWVAACHVCNNLKGPRRFDSVREARAYIQTRAAEKGYVYPRFM